MPTKPKRPQTDVAKVFWSGRSQAVRLPQQYRLSCREVAIHREGNKLVLEPSAEATDALGWPVSFWELFGQLDDDFEVGDRHQPHERKSPLK